MRSVIATIRLHEFRRQWETVRDEALRTIDGVGRSGRWILGEAVEKFEAALAGFCGRRYAVGCASGLDAIEIALRAAGLQAQEAVLTTPLSAFATTLAVWHIGAVPVFADVDVSGCIDLRRCEEILGRRRDIRYFLPVHLYGHFLPSDALRQFAERFSLTLIEDMAQAIGGGP